MGARRGGRRRRRGRRGGRGGGRRARASPRSGRRRRSRRGGGGTRSGLGAHRVVGPRGRTAAVPRRRDQRGLRAHDRHRQGRRDRRARRPRRPGGRRPAGPVARDAAPARRRPGALLLMQLHLHEWGDPAAPALVCLHGVSAHGRRFRKLAEEQLATRYHVVAPDLRGHGRSGWEPPWDIETHVEDVLESVAAAGIERALWIGHSFGGRLVLELGARRPELIEQAVLLDPAIQLLPNVGLDLAEDARRDEAYETLEAAIAAGLTVRTTTPLEFVEEDVREHLELGSDGLHRPRYCRSAVVT